MTRHFHAPHISRPLAVFAIAGVALVLAACDNTPMPLAAGSRLALGTWGGNNVALTATDSLTHVHVGCTFGDFPGDIALDANGHFAVDGAYMLHAFPVAVGPSMPAQLSGQVQGNTLTFAIAVNDTTAKQVVSVGPGTVVLGQEPIMGACPVCLIPNRKRVSLIAPSRDTHVYPARKTHR
jgi:hypothetical protein